MSVGERNELLFAHGVNFSDLPAWQKRGVGLRWQAEEHVGHNPISGEAAPVSHHRLVRDRELPRGEAYAALVGALIEKSLAEEERERPRARLA